MKYTRLYTDSGGETHFEDVDVDFSLRGRAGDQAPALDAKALQFQRTKGEQNAVDWHTAPRSQFIIQVSGATEGEVSDGDVRRFGPGTIILVEDTTGKGHITRTVDDGTEERVMLFVHLTE
jgi:quercetin dioxygenase-like cupin family protein